MALSDPLHSAAESDAAATNSAGTKADARHPWLPAFFGCVAALAVVQLVLMPLSSGVHRDWDPISSDTVGGSVVIQRWYYEGIATSHFSSAHARLTGNAYIPGAPVGVLLGDSYVEALQLDDRATMGSVIERAARAEGLPLNVRQYGYSGASPARYVVEAPDVTARWHPAFVAVVLTEDVFTHRAPFVGDDYLVLNADSSVTAHHNSARRGGWSWKARNAAAWVLEHFTLADKVVVRAARLGETMHGGESAGRAAADSSAAFASVKALREAYGDRLAIVYVPTIGVVPADDDTTNERPFLGACAATKTRCVSAGQILREDRERRMRISRGFTNSAPGGGHLNRVGAMLVGSLTWASVKDLVLSRPTTH